MPTAGQSLVDVIPPEPAAPAPAMGAVDSLVGVPVVGAVVAPPGGADGGVTRRIFGTRRYSELGWGHVS